MHAAARSTSEANTTNARTVAAIPARWASSRLPGKPLRALAGKPIIEHVWRRLQDASQLDRVVVLTDDERIFEAVQDFSGEAIMTPAECATGTDRIAWAAREWDEEIVLNIQGDEPLIDPGAVDLLARHMRESEAPMATLATPASLEELSGPDVVKVVRGAGGAALYFSRALIPYQRGAAPAPQMRHIGIYAYRRSVLERLAATPPTPLERAESLEQLRALETGIPIHVLEVAEAHSGVDTIEDLERLETLLVERQHVSQA